MNQTQPTAIRLADELDGLPANDFYEALGDEAAAELRRLQAENEALREANEAFAVRQDWWNDRMFELETQRDQLLEALKMAWPLIQTEKFKQDGRYGSNFVQAKADRIYAAYNNVRAALDKVWE